MDDQPTMRGRPRSSTPAARRARILVRAIGLTIGLTFVCAPSALAVGEFDVTTFDASLSTAQAGAHADQTIEIALQPELMDGFPVPSFADGIRSLDLDLPPGLLGTISKFPTCPRELLQDVGAPGAEPCPEASQLGNLRLTTQVFFSEDTQNYPIYNMEPGAGHPARIALVLGQIAQPVDLSVRTGGDYGLRASSNDIPTSKPIKAMTISLWGVPSDASHDELRYPCGSNNLPPGSQCPATAPRVPFMQNPTDCTKPMTTTLRVRNYSVPDRWITRESTMPAPTGCENLAFEPSVAIQADNRTAGKPSAANVAITVPQNEDPDGLASPALRTAIVKMPEGVSINPAVALDRAACADWAFGKRSAGASNCPRGAKVGTFSLDVPALRAPLPGDIYLGEPHEGNPYRLFLYAEGQGVRVKLEGGILPDPRTGQITAVFEDNPQVPFRTINLRFVGGPSGVLLMPETCGTRQLTASLTPYSSTTPVGAAWPLQITSGCADGPQPFAPTFEAGVTGADAGADTGFLLRFGAPDGHKTLSGLKVGLPAGLLGRLTAVPLCPADLAARAACSDESLVGGVTVSAGSTDGPLNLPGKVWLAEGYQPGQVAALAIAVPAIVGPYNLGTPVVRAGITVNRDTSLSVESEPLPTILQGVPLRIRQVLVRLDLPGFMFNPSDCSPKRITGAITAGDETVVGVESPFAVRGCAALPFSPGAAMSIPAPSKEGGTTGLRFRLLPRPGDAHLRQVQVILPSGVGARLDGPLQTQCSGAAFAQDACGAQSKVGTATASTPVLPQPLAGDAFFLENGSGSGLPKLAIRLKGLVTIDLVGEVAITPGGRVVATFAGIPDVPISAFELALDTAGPNTPLTAGGLCGRKAIADVSMIGHSGKQHAQQIVASVTGCKPASKAKKSKSKKGKGKSKKDTPRGSRSAEG